MHQDVTYFERAQAYTEKMVKYSADTWSVEAQKQFYAVAKPSYFSTA